MTSSLHVARGHDLMKEIRDQFLVCKICLEKYRQPKTLACLHTFCEACLIKLQDAQQERSYRYLLNTRPFISCPICRKPTDLPPGGVRRLPDNFLVSSLDTIIGRRTPSGGPDASETSTPFCEICDRQRQNGCQNKSWRTKAANSEQASINEEINGSSNSRESFRKDLYIRRNRKEVDDSATASSLAEVEKYSRQFRTQLQSKSQPPGGSSSPIYSSGRYISTVSNSFRDRSSIKGTSMERYEDADDARRAVSKCLDCSKHLCRTCLELHRSTKVTQDHSLVDVEVEQKDVECSVHEGEIIRFYCEPCSRCICVVCAFQDHSNHDVSTLTEGVDRHRHSMDDLVAQCRERCDRLRHHVALIDRCEGDLDRIEGQIRDTAVEGIDTIRRREQEILDSLTSKFSDSTTKEFLNRKSELQQAIQSLESTCYLTDVITRDRSVELLLLKDEISKKMASLLEKSRSESPPDCVKRRISFVPGNLVFGYLSMDCSPRVSLSDALNLESIESVAAFSNVQALCGTGSLANCLPSELTHSSSIFGNSENSCKVGRTGSVTNSYTEIKTPSFDTHKPTGVSSVLRQTSPSFSIDNVYTNDLQVINGLIEASVKSKTETCDKETMTRKTSLRRRSDKPRVSSCTRSTTTHSSVYVDHKCTNTDPTEYLQKPNHASARSHSMSPCGDRVRERNTSPPQRKIKRRAGRFSGRDRNAALITRTMSNPFPVCSDIEGAQIHNDETPRRLFIHTRSDSCPADPSLIFDESRGCTEVVVGRHRVSNPDGVQWRSSSVDMVGRVSRMSAERGEKIITVSPDRKLILRSPSDSSHKLNQTCNRHLESVCQTKKTSIEEHSSILTVSVANEIEIERAKRSRVTVSFPLMNSSINDEAASVDHSSVRQRHYSERSETSLQTIFHERDSHKITSSKNPSDTNLKAKSSADLQNGCKVEIELAHYKSNLPCDQQKGPNSAFLDGSASTFGDVGLDSSKALLEFLTEPNYNSASGVKVSLPQRVNSSSNTASVVDKSSGSDLGLPMIRHSTCNTAICFDKQVGGNFGLPSWVHTDTNTSQIANENCESHFADQSLYSSSTSMQLDTSFIDKPSDASLDQNASNEARTKEIIKEYQTSNTEIAAVESATESIQVANDSGIEANESQKIYNDDSKESERETELTDNCENRNRASLTARSKNVNLDNIIQDKQSLDKSCDSSENIDNRSTSAESDEILNQRFAENNHILAASDNTNTEKLNQLYDTACLESNSVQLTHDSCPSMQPKSDAHDSCYRGEIYEANDEIPAMAGVPAGQQDQKLIDSDFKQEPFTCNTIESENYEAARPLSTNSKQKINYSPNFTSFRRPPIGRRCRSLILFDAVDFPECNDFYLENRPNTESKCNPIISSYTKPTVSRGCSPIDFEESCFAIGESTNTAGGTCEYNEINLSKSHKGDDKAPFESANGIDQSINDLERVNILKADVTKSDVADREPATMNTHQVSTVNNDNKEGETDVQNEKMNCHEIADKILSETIHDCAVLNQHKLDACTVELTVVKDPGYDRSCNTSPIPLIHTASGDSSVTYLDASTEYIPAHVSRFEKETNTPVILQMNASVGTNSLSTSDKGTSTPVDITAIYRQLVASAGPRVTVSRGTSTPPRRSTHQQATCTTPPPDTLDRASSPVKILHHDKGVMANEAERRNTSKDTFQAAGRIPPKPVIPKAIQEEPKLDCIQEDSDEASSEDDQFSTRMEKLPVTNTRRSATEPRRGGKIYRGAGRMEPTHRETFIPTFELKNQSAKNPSGAVSSVFGREGSSVASPIIWRLEKGTNTASSKQLVDKCIGTESVMVNGKMAECISKLRTVRERLECQQSPPLSIRSRPRVQTISIASESRVIAEGGGEGVEDDEAPKMGALLKRWNEGQTDAVKALTSPSLQQRRKILEVAQQRRQQQRRQQQLQQLDRLLSQTDSSESDDLAQDLPERSEKFSEKNLKHNLVKSFPEKSENGLSNNSILDLSETSEKNVKKSPSMARKQRLDLKHLLTSFTLPDLGGRSKTSQPSALAVLGRAASAAGSVISKATGGDGRRGLMGGGRTVGARIQPVASLSSSSLSSSLSSSSQASSTVLSSTETVASPEAIVSPSAAAASFLKASASLSSAAAVLLPAQSPSTSGIGPINGKSAKGFQSPIVSSPLALAAGRTQTEKPKQITRAKQRPLTAGSQGRGLALSRKMVDDGRIEAIKADKIVRPKSASERPTRGANLSKPAAAISEKVKVANEEEPCEERDGQRKDRQEVTGKTKSNDNSDFGGCTRANSSDCAVLRVTDKNEVRMRGTLRTLDDNDEQEAGSAAAAVVTSAAAAALERRLPPRSPVHGPQTAKISADTVVSGVTRAATEKPKSASTATAASVFKRTTTSDATVAVLEEAKVATKAVTKEAAASSATQKPIVKKTTVISKPNSRSAVTSKRLTAGLILRTAPSATETLSELEEEASEPESMISAQTARASTLLPQPLPSSEELFSSLPQTSSHVATPSSSSAAWCAEGLPSLPKPRPVKSLARPRLAERARLAEAKKPNKYFS